MTTILERKVNKFLTFLGKSRKFKAENQSKKVIHPAYTTFEQFLNRMLNQAQTQPLQHQSVLVSEVLHYLQLARKRVVVDGTLGLGGHSLQLLQNMPKNGKLFAFELDPEHIKEAKKTLKDFKEQVVFINGNFSTLKEELSKTRMKGIDAILLDLGLASPHVDIAEKGFSFMHEGPLDMRFDQNMPATAADVVNKYSQKELLRIFKEYGEERKARKIVMEIMRVRKRKPFKTTTQLAKFIEKLVHREGRIHPATRVFQALRIEVNHELDVLQSVLNQAVELLRPNGRIAVISYHSLEDRIVKQFFKALSLDYVNVPGELRTTKLKPQLKIITKKPIVPTLEEVARNPRSRSAKLRVAEKI
jgi:16S rRNA (cytosine1402-N4)-methyltransferase